MIGGFIGSPIGGLVREGFGTGVTSTLTLMLPVDYQLAGHPPYVARYRTVEQFEGRAETRSVGRKSGVAQLGGPAKRSVTVRSSGPAKG